MIFLIFFVHNLEKYGWSEFFEKQYAVLRDTGLQPARVAVEFKKNYLLYGSDGEITGELKRRFFHVAAEPGSLPKVGDWVLIEKKTDNTAVIHYVLERKSWLSRKMPGKKISEQIVAANIDFVFVVVALEYDFTLRKIERMLVAVRESGAEPIIILNKADLDPEYLKKLEDTKTANPNIPIFCLSTVTNLGYNELSQILQPQKTYAFIGSSGVGKSTIINQLFGDKIRKTADRDTCYRGGLHVTTTRELIVLQNGAILIDMPGIRELQIWGTEEGLEEAFPDIAEIAKGCKFTDCTHTHEVNCAVKEAVKNRRLAQERYNNYIRMYEEISSLDKLRIRSKMLEKQTKLSKIKKLYLQNKKTRNPDRR
ncbi:MAG: ribosome small subunit-dependent GTPase A [Ignavibacteria bacterium]